MSAAPYNPATLRRIRAGASAADLGWDRERYLRICREHHIEPVADRGNAGAAIAPAPMTITVGQVSYNRATCIIHRGYNDVLLSGEREKAIFAYLFTLASTGDETLVSRTKLIEQTGGECDEHHISAMLVKLEAKLAPVGCHLAVHQGKSGGVRLVVRP